MLATQVEEFLSDLQGLLEQLTQVQTRKQQALAKLDTSELTRLSTIEAELAERLDGLPDRRDELLGAAAASGAPTASFRRLIRDLPEATRTPLADRLARVRDQAKEAKRRIAVNWLATYRSNHHIRELLGIITATGKQDADAPTPNGGLMLDSTA